MNEQLTFYIDVLGTRDAIKNRDETKGAALLKLLSDLASHRGEFNLSPSRLEEGFIVTEIRPAVSTFSDLMVISYPVEELQKVNEWDALGQGLQMAVGLIASLAAAAMNIGFLIRGGATVGPLNHEGGVILGPALVEAYELESRHAIYPRIVVSRKLYARVKFAPRVYVLLTDHDGITHLNYFTEMLLRSDQIEESRAFWLGKVGEIIEENIARFELEERWNELAKWVWFKKQLEQARQNAAPLIR